jgi:hypothetical protein
MRSWVHFEKKKHTSDSRCPCLPTQGEIGVGENQIKKNVLPLLGNLFTHSALSGLRPCRSLLSVTVPWTRLPVFFFHCPVQHTCRLPSAWLSSDFAWILAELWFAAFIISWWLDGSKWISPILPLVCLLFAVVTHATSHSVWCFRSDNSATLAPRSQARSSAGLYKPSEIILMHWGDPTDRHRWKLEFETSWETLCS